MWLARQPAESDFILMTKFRWPCKVKSRQKTLSAPSNGTKRRNEFEIKLSVGYHTILLLKEHKVDIE
jgi:hypothetical protein